MKKSVSIIKNLLLTSIILLAVSCSSYKDVPYFQNVSNVDLSQLEQQPLYDAKIMPKDILLISVNCTDPEISAPFNLTMQSTENLNTQRTTTQSALIQYLVSNEGNIEFPVLGTLHIGGLTKIQAENMIREKLIPFLKEVPIVTVRMSDFKISVLGEVNHPGQYTISKEKVNVLEALALAGDMTIYGIRDNVQLIREDASGKREVHTLNLKDIALIQSPYYQLQQNDIIYVTPNKTKAKNSDIGQSTTLWFSATSILVSLTSLLYNILK